MVEVRHPLRVMTEITGLVFGGISLNKQPQSVLPLKEVTLSPGTGEGESHDAAPASRAVPEYIRPVACHRARQINGNVGLALGAQSCSVKYVEATAQDDAVQINGDISLDAFRALIGLSTPK